jgi:hypothetical protein
MVFRLLPLIDSLSLDSPKSVLFSFHALRVREQKHQVIVVDHKFACP